MSQNSRFDFNNSFPVQGRYDNGSTATRRNIATHELGLEHPQDADDGDQAGARMSTYPCGLIGTS